MRHSIKFFFLPFIAVVLLLPIFILLAQFGGSAPVISEVQISGIDENSALVEWKTDKETDGTINYGLNENRGIIRYPIFDKKEHKIKIDKLEPSTTYHFRVVSADKKGNKTSSAGFVFTTKGTQAIPGIDKIQDAKEQALVEKTLATAGKITSPEAMALVVKDIRGIAGKLIRPPAIIGAPKVYTEADFAEITWTTDRDASSMVFFVSDDEYNKKSVKPYVFSQGDPIVLTKKHTVKIIGLEPSTLYHFKVVSEDGIGLIGESEDDTFTTKSILPKIARINVIKIQETSATITWSTGGVLAEGLIEYTNLRTNATKSAGDPVFSANHQVQLTDLEFGTRYSAIIRSTNEAGDETASEPFTFITIRDEAPPLISKVSNESTIFPGAEIKIQTIIAWETDEPSLCQVFYSQGLIGNGSEGESLPQELNPVSDHVKVVVGFSQSTVYRFWLLCEDLAGNTTRSEDFVLITPVKEKNIIDIIIENFEGTFGWVKNITG